jgi:hypothetical protein
LGPSTPYDLPESELDFAGKRLLTVEGLEAGTFELSTRTGTIDRTEEGIAWNPFATGGDTVLGRIEIECSSTEGLFTFLIELRPSRLTTAHWRTLVRHLRSVSDGLLTSFFSASHVRVPATQVGARRINGGVMFAQLQKQMSGFLSSVAAIARNPRRDFQPGLPKLGRSKEAPSAEIYENAIVWLSVDAVLETLRQTQRSCEEECGDLRKELSLLGQKKGGGYVSRNAKVESLERALLQLREWHARLSDLARQLPAEKVARGLRGTPPHLSVRLQGNAHYVRVVRFAMRVGRERVLEAESRWRSSLSARRSSTLFEFWALFALLRAFGALGYGSVNVDFGTFLKSAPFETTPKPNTEFLLRHEQRKETIALHYELLARSVPTKRKTTADWHDELTAAQVEGFAGKNVLWTPDFWLELRRDDGAVAAAVGDAIFTDQVDGEFGITSKAAKVANYVKNVVRARGSQPLIKAWEVGFVIHCNDKPMDLMKLATGDQVFLSFVPQLAEGDTEEDPGDAFAVSPETLKELGEYLEELRSAMGPLRTEG